MAIAQASLAEEILSRQERAVLRGVYRAAQLAEAVKALDNLSLIFANHAIEKSPDEGTISSAAVCNIRTQDLRSFLTEACFAALAATKVPTLSVSKKASSNQMSV